MESVEGEVPKMEELKIAEVGKKDHDIRYKASTAPPVRPERLQFKDIPLDMKRMIFSYITLPSDRKSLCLTSKEFQEITLPILYRTVKLLVGGPRDMRLSAGLLSRDNPGLKHIRRLYLDLERVTVPKAQMEPLDDSSDEAEEFEDVAIAVRQANFTIRLLLDVIPVNTLECFNWNNWMRISADNSVLLWKKQKRLREIEIDATDLPLIPILEKDPNVFKDFKDVLELAFYPDKLDGLRVCQKILQASPGIKELTVSAGAFKASDERVPDDLQDTSTRAGLISRTVFSHLQPFDRCSPHMLTWLRLEHISLRYAVDTYLRVINFSVLKSLELYQCDGDENLFAQLSKPHIRPGQLKHLHWIQRIINESHVLEAFEGMLESLLGLETLHIEIDTIDNLPKAKAIRHHGKTLKYLSIHVQSINNTLNYEPAEFTDICTSCPELVQLSVAFPNTSVDSAEASPDYATVLTSIKKLPNLVTLVIGRWPVTHESFINSRGKIKPRCFELYKHKLLRVVQNIFEMSDRYAIEMNWGLGKRSMLSVIAMGVNGAVMWDGHHDAKVEQVQYVRGQQVDAFGNRSMTPVKIERHLVRFIEPESDILNVNVFGGL